MIKTKALRIFPDESQTKLQGFQMYLYSACANLELDCSVVQKMSENFLPKISGQRNAATQNRAAFIGPTAQA